MAPFIAGVLTANYPDVQLTFDVLNSTPNVLPDHYDLAFLPSYGILPDSDVVTKRVVRTPYELVASPGWLAAAGELRSAKDLQGLAGIGWWQAGANPTWRLFGGRGEQHEIKIRPTLQTNNLFVARDAAIAGLGMARLPKPLSEGEIAAGRLARVLENYRPAPVTIFVAYPSRRSLTAAGRAFLDWLTKDAASYIAAFGDAAN
jgi:DNA-binding transcriptional LysR family regulator